MSVLLAVLAFLAGFGAYFATGMRLVGRPYVTRSVQSRCERYPNLAVDHTEDWRRVATFEALFVSAIWPLYLTFRSLVSRVADGAPLSDYELRRELEGRDRRIAELERELGVDRRRG